MIAKTNQTHLTLFATLTLHVHVQECIMTIKMMSHYKLLLDQQKHITCMLCFRYKMVINRLIPRWLCPQLLKPCALWPKYCFIARATCVTQRALMWRLSMVWWDEISKQDSRCWNVYIWHKLILYIYNSLHVLACYIHVTTVAFSHHRWGSSLVSRLWDGWVLTWDYIPEDVVPHMPRLNLVGLAKP